MRHVLSELLQGERAHTNSLHCIDVSAEVAGRRSSNLPHSVFEFAWHMDFWMSHELERISGSPLPYPEHASLGWPTAPTPGLKEWRRARDDFRGSVRKVQEIAAAEPAERERVVLNSSPLEGTRQYTVEEIVWQTAVHTATGSTAASYFWENGHCQMRGSECDSGAKRSIIDAADEIAAAILGSPGPAPDRVIQSVEAGVLVAGNTRFALPEPCPHFRANGKVRLAPAYPGRGCAVDRLLRRVHNLTLTCEVECSSVE